MNISNWLLIALIAFLWIKFALFRGNNETFDTTSSRKPLINNPIMTANNSIANYHIFGSAEKLYDMPLSQGQTSLNFTLNGTMSQNDAKTGLAYISNIQGVQNKYAVGDKVFDTATLLEIHKTYVVLDNKGKKERLSLPEKLSNSSNNSQEKKPSPNNSGLTKHLKGGDWENMMQQQKFDPNTISSIVNNSNLMIDQAGAIKGIRVSSLASGAVDLNKVGLKPSDIITAVNGNQISGNNLIELGKTIQDNPNTIITIKRNGKIHNIEININDLNR